MKTAPGGLERGAMMFNHRLTRTAAIAVAIAATGASAASAQPIDSRLSVDAPPAYSTPLVDPPQDLRNPDTRDFAEGRGTYNTVSPAPVRDLRNPDTRDFAEGRGTYNSPEVVVVKAPPVAEPTATGIDWEDVGIGAGGLLAASLIALGGTLLVVQRRGAHAHAAH
jgi:hypothetical protein